MTTPEQLPEQPDLKFDIWKLMMRQVAEIPGRYRTAQANQAYAVRLTSQLPIGFNDETVGYLSADSILAQNLQFINLCLATLQGNVAFSATKLNPDLQNILPIMEHESVEGIFGYNPLQDSWRINLSSGNIANLPTALLSNVIEYRP